MSFKKTFFGFALAAVSLVSFAQQSSSDQSSIFDGKNEDGLVSETVYVPASVGESDAAMVEFLRKYLPYPSNVAGAKLVDLKISSLTYRVSALDEKGENHPIPENKVLSDWTKGAFLAMGYEITGSKDDPEVEVTGFCEDSHCIANLWLKRTVSFEVGKGEVVKLEATPVMHWDSFRSFEPKAGKRADVVLDITKDVLKSFSLDVIKAVSN